MNGYVLAPVALADIDEIAAQIAEADPDVALRFIDDMHETFAFLARHPHAGHPRPDLTDRPVFFWPVRKTYAVIYRSAAAFCCRTICRTASPGAASPSPTPSRRTLTRCWPRCLQGRRGREPAPTRRSDIHYQEPPLPPGEGRGEGSSRPPLPPARPRRARRHVGTRSRAPLPRRCRHEMPRSKVKKIDGTARHARDRTAAIPLRRPPRTLILCIGGTIG